MDAAGSSRAAEWRRNWPLVLACSVGFSFPSVLNHAFGLFIQPLGDEFGWGRAKISAGLALVAIVSVLFSPVVGHLVDRWGVRRLALPGVVLLSGSIAAFSFANGSYTQWIALWAIFAVVDLSVKSTVWTTAVAYAFDSARSLALAFTIGGVSFSLIIGPPLVQWLIADFGWRMAFVWLGFGWGGVTFLLCLVGLKVKRVDSQSSSAEPKHLDKPAGGLTVAQAFRNIPLLRIALATFLTMFLGIGIQVHLVPIYTGSGFSRANAAYLVSLGGVAGIVGKIITGWLMDRYNAGLVGSLTLAGSAVGYAFLVEWLRTPTLLILGMVIIGYAAAAKMQICAYMTSRYAGMRNFGTIFGFMSSLIALGGGLGPFFAGLVFDAFGTYDPLLIASVGGTLVAAALIFGLGTYPDWSGTADDANSISTPN